MRGGIFGAAAWKFMPDSVISAPPFAGAQV
jgi:hypothetical protein